MNDFLRVSSWINLIVLLILLTGGCAYISEKAPIGYGPRTFSSPIAGVNRVRVRVVVMDERSDKSDKVSHKSEVLSDPSSKETAMITATRSVPMTVCRALERELENSGYILGTGGAVVQVKLERFYNEWVTGFFFGSAVANFRMTVTVLSDKDTAKQFYVTSINGTGIHKNCQLASGANAGMALTSALTQGMHRLMGDSRFSASIMEAGITAEPTTKNIETIPKPSVVTPAPVAVIQPVANKIILEEPSNEEDPDLKRFIQLKQLRADGLLTEEEYNEGRKRIADKVLKSTAP